MSSPIDKYCNAVPPRPMQRFEMFDKNFYYSHASSLNIFIFVEIEKIENIAFVNPKHFLTLLEEKLIKPI
jgi:hypothetical protein